MLFTPYSVGREVAPLPKARAYWHIRDQIVRGALAGGEKLHPEKIASELGLSRTPVREAIAQLDAEGLVKTRPNQATIVTLLPPNEIGEFFQIRAVLEGLAARSAAATAREADIEQLSLLNQQLRRTDLDNSTWRDCHEKFHDFAAEISGLKHLQQEIRRIRTAISPYLIFYFAEYRLTEMVGAEHAVLIDAIRSRNPLLAERAFVGHVTIAGQSAVQFIKARQDKPDTGQTRSRAHSP
jgi:DNA-binding GntR family transcriptional regulator